MLSKISDQTGEGSLPNDHSSGRIGLVEVRILEYSVQGENNNAAGGRDAMTRPRYQSAQVEEVDPCPPEKWTDTDLATLAKDLFAIQDQECGRSLDGAETAPAKFPALFRCRKCKIRPFDMVKNNSGARADLDFTQNLDHAVCTVTFGALDETIQ